MLPVLVMSVFVVGLMPAAAAGAPPYQHVGTITEPNTSLNDAFGSFDISFVDAAHDVMYLADRGGLDTFGTFVRGRIDVVDADDGAFIGYLGNDQFAGNYNNPRSPVAACAETPRDPRSGPNGVATDDSGFVWVGDGNHASGGCGTGPDGKTFASGPSSVKVYNPTTGAMTRLVIGGNRRADELAIGELTSGAERVLISNPEEVKPSFPFSTLIDADNMTVLGKLVFDQPKDGHDPDDVPPPGHGWDSSLQDTAGSGGLEQDVWDPGTQSFFLNVPGTTLNMGGEIDQISPNLQGGNVVITKVMPLNGCNGSGLAISGNMLVVQCGGDIRVVDKNTGAEIQRFTQGGGADEIWFNPGDGNVYQGIIGPPVTPVGGIGVLDLTHMVYLGVIPVAPGLGTHSVAADSKTNRIFLPMAEGSVAKNTAGNGGIGMFQHDDTDGQLSSVATQ